MKSGTDAAASSGYGGPRAFVRFAILNKPRELYTLWLLDLFRQTPISYIEVSFALSMSLTESLNVDLRMPCFGQKMI